MGQTHQLYSFHQRVVVAFHLHLGVEHRYRGHADESADSGPGKGECT